MTTTPLRRSTYIAPEKPNSRWRNPFKTALVQLESHASKSQLGEDHEGEKFTVLEWRRDYAAGEPSIVDFLDSYETEAEAETHAESLNANQGDLFTFFSVMKDEDD